MFISDKDVARKVIKNTSTMITLVEKELVDLGDKIPEEEYNQCQYRVGELLYTLCNVINDISINHPDLKPKDFPVYVRKEVSE
ncbi:hypothetical protein [Dickeya chrysanthemi]|uniref:hypothetical protein n=1 Tax=Dickeya chrysanthemi TaxID=556 RepID=UPI000532E1DA|nr:hypothetical protein [Dickeya chrysanthemi]